MDISIKIQFDWKEKNGEFFRITYFISDEQLKILGDKRIYVTIKNSDYYEYLNSKDPTLRLSTFYSIADYALGKHDSGVWKKARTEDFGTHLYSKLNDKEVRDEFINFYTSKLMSKINAIIPSESTSTLNIQLANVDGTGLNDSSVLSKIDFELPQFMILNGTTYKVNLEPLKGRKSLAGLGNVISNKLHALYSAQAKTLQASLAKEVKNLSFQLDETKKTSFMEGLKTFKMLAEKGWTIDKKGRLFNPMRIVVKKFQFPDGKFYLPPPDVEFFVEGISMDLNSTIRTLYAQKAYHPNAQNTQDSYLCMGDLKEKPILEVINGIVALYELGNHEDYGYSGSCETHIKRLFKEGKFTEIKSEVWEGRHR